MDSRRKREMCLCSYSQFVCSLSVCMFFVKYHPNTCKVKNEVFFAFLKSFLYEHGVIELF